MGRTTTDVHVVPVQSRGDLEAFIAFPFALYRNDPRWVAPLIGPQRHELDRGHAPFFDHGVARYFLARRHHRVVGRISAHVDTRYNAFHAVEMPDQTGFWGFFECEDDIDVAFALFDAAASWLREQGMVRMFGPASFTLNHVAGLLVDGFDTSPMPLMAYNPPYYERLVERAGFAKAQDLWAYRLDATAPIPEEIRTFAATAEADGFTFRSMDKHRYWDEVARFAEVYNEAWERNRGFVPMTADEIGALAKELKPIIDPGLVFIAEKDGDVAAAGLTIPNVNEVLVDHRGRLGAVGTAQLLFRMRRHRFESCRVVALGVKRRFRQTGVGAHLYVDTMEAARARGFRWGEMSWILETNDAMNAGIRHMGGIVYKWYRMYARDTAH
ncbi:MAG: N-acetyltransferase [Actinomycetota bacterium]